MNSNKVYSTISNRKAPRFRPGSGIGFRYTPDQAAAIERACDDAEKWMSESYGKGARPHRLGIGDR